jgi:hypothetical protein
MVAAYYQMISPEVAADQRVPQRFSRTGEPHRERQKGQKDLSRVEILTRQFEVRTDADEMINVARLRESRHGMKQ